MPSNWHVKPRDWNVSVAQLTRSVIELTEEATEALREGGEYGRRYRQAVANLAVAERRLSSAKAKEEQRKKEATLSPSEIVDRVMRR